MAHIFDFTKENHIKYEDMAKQAKSSVSFYNVQQGNLEDGFYCEKCKNRGGFMELLFKKITKSGQPVPFEYWIPCECMEVRRSEKNSAKSGLDKYLKKTFDNFREISAEVKEIKRLGLENSKELKKWFYIGGQSGAGKSHITAAIANTLLRQGKQVMYSSWIKDFKSLNFRDENFKYKMHDLKTVDNLLIDDVFKKKEGESITNADLQVFYEVINQRYNSNLKTIISSEVTMEELIKIDEATASRIVEMAGKYILTIERDRNKNYRLQGE